MQNLFLGILCNISIWRVYPTNEVLPPADGGRRHEQHVPAGATERIFAAMAPKDCGTFPLVAPGGGISKWLKTLAPDTSLNCYQQLQPSYHTKGQWFFCWAHPQKCFFYNGGFWRSGKLGFVRWRKYLTLKPQKGLYNKLVDGIFQKFDTKTTCWMEQLLGNFTAWCWPPIPKTEAVLWAWAC